MQVNGITMLRYVILRQLINGFAAAAARSAIDAGKLLSLQFYSTSLRFFFLLRAEIWVLLPGLHWFILIRTRPFFLSPSCQILAPVHRGSTSSDHYITKHYLVLMNLP